MIEQNYSRSANGGVGYAKAGGNYAGQFYPTQLAIDKGYDQVIWTDDNTHEYIEEAGAMNIFVRINDTLITGPTSDRILDGITRKSILDIAKDEGIKVDVRKFTVTEVVEASENGSLKEMFGAGTAAVISPIAGLWDSKTPITTCRNLKTQSRSTIKKPHHRHSDQQSRGFIWLDCKRIEV